MYLKNNINGVIGFFNSYQAGWSPATAEESPLPQEEIDAYLLEMAKNVKIQELNKRLFLFTTAGYEYPGDIVCSTWTSGVEYQLDSTVSGSDEKNYRSLKNNNLDNDPVSAPAWWEEFYPFFKTDDRTSLNLIVKNASPAGSEKYIFRDKDKIPVNFSDSVNWAVFFEEMAREKDRIMVKYNDYYKEINFCVTIPEVEAIVINFAE